MGSAKNEALIVTEIAAEHCYHAGMTPSPDPVFTHSLERADTATAPGLSTWSVLLGTIASAHHARAGQRSVVLLPFVQLLPMAKQQWLATQTSGLLPRFETSSSWAASLPPVALSAHDYRQNMAQDSLQARALLAAQGQSQHQDQIEALYRPLLDICAELAPLAAACPPAERSAWGQRWQTELPSLLPEGDFLNTERLLQASAAAWLGYSNFASDVLFSAAAGEQFEQLIVVQGLHPDPLASSLAAYWQNQGKTVLRLPFHAPLEISAPLPADSSPTLYACADGQDLLAHSALAVLQLLEQGCKPVALIAQDRHITRQLRATLEAQGAQIKDETGWKLSTTHAASHLLALLDAALQPASNPTQLAWLKACLPADHAALRQLETWLARAHTPLAQTAVARQAFSHAAGSKTDKAVLDAVLALLESLAQVQQLLPKSGRMAIGLWQERLAQALALHGQEAQLSRDEAGAQILRLVQQHCAHERPLSLQGFCTWLRDVLENAHFLSPTAPQQADVLVLPLAQMLGRSVAAVVWPGLDAQRLPLLPKQISSLSRAQRAALGLPSPEDLAAAQKQAFLLALQQPRPHLLWQTLEGEQALAPSPLLLAWQQTLALPNTPLPALPLHDFARQSVLPPQAQAGALRLPHISASAYEALRRCPYQFFASRLLGLKATAELDQDPDNSDWGQFVHATLLAFHQALQTQTQAQTPPPSAAELAALLQRCAQAQMQQLQADMGDAAALLLPHRHAWPQLAANYLAWLAADAPQGWGFAQGEFLPEPQRTLALDAPEAPLRLTGSIDRLDRHANGQLRVLDYKTSAADRLKTQVKNPQEDTQLPFYALLLGEDAQQVQSLAYLSLREQDATCTIEQSQWQEAATALEAGMQSDLNRIYAGSPMPALGSDSGACQYCEVRGLCRKGHWAELA